MKIPVGKKRGSQRHIDQPQAVFFDFGDTLVETEPQYLERMRMAIENLGVTLTLRQLEEAYVLADYKSAETTLNENPFDHQRHSEIFIRTMADKLEIHNMVEVIVPNLDEEIAKFKLKRKLMDGAKAVLDTVKQKGFKAGIISNNDGRTREKCDDVGITSYFDVILDSTQEGVSKPNPEFFRIAMERMGIDDPSKVLHVGDLPGSDAMGADKLGIQTIWLNIRQIPLKLQVPTVKTMEELREAIDSL